MNVVSLVSNYALHVPQHVAVSLSEPLNQKMVSSAPAQSLHRLDYAYPDTRGLV